jgi:eukaryotic-like serine/threonine-protein kinase
MAQKLTNRCHVPSIGSAYWLLLGLWNGLSRETLDDHLRTRPNQGILRSVHSALLVGGLTGIVCFMVSLLNQFIANFFYYGLSFGLIVGLSDGLSFGLSDGLSFGLMSFGFLLGCAGFLLAALLTGGLASLRHVLLRLQLRHLGLMPRHYVRFLDVAARRILLYKDGGGYRFIHRLFLDYFADLEAEPSRALSAAQGTGMAQEQTNGVTAAPQSS